MAYEDIYPERVGKLDIFPEIHDGDLVEVTIIGDPEGLRYLAELLNNLADENQIKNDEPEGSRMHIHLHRNNHLGGHSCEVEVCRADAKGTGEWPEFMQT